MPLFNNALDLKLLELVKDNPCLYNPTHPKHSDLDVREVVWQKIGDALNRPAQKCKRRWVNIKDMMRRKLRERIRNPDQLSYHYRYEDQLAFMIPHFRESSLLPAIPTDYSEFEENCDIDDTFMQPEYLEEPPEKVSNKREESNAIDRVHLNDVPNECKTTDPLEVFLLTIGSTLRKFSPYYLNQAKSKIFQVVQEYELEQICKNKDGRGSHGDVGR